MFLVMSITNDFIKYLRNKGYTVEDRRGKALGGNSHNRSLSGINRGGTHWDAAANGTIRGHETHWKNNNGWKMGGYTAFVPKSGIIQVNYDFETRTNGVGNHNTPTLNFCYGGNSSSPMNDSQKRALKDMWTFVVNDRRININSFDSVWGHNEFPGHSSNQCPGINMNEFRKYLKTGSGNVTTPSKPAPAPSKPGNSLQGAKLVKKENGRFTVTAEAGIRVRTAPSTSATQTGILKKGNAINYDEVYEGNGYRWLAYTGESGNRRYVPYRTLSNPKDQWGTFGSQKASTPKPAPKPKGYNISVDGYLGKETVRALQSYFKLKVDGEIWGQYSGNQAPKAFDKSAVKFGKGGSPVVRALQKKIGTTADGHWGAGTTRALQRYLGTPIDGVISRPSTVIKELQRRLKNGTF